MPLCSWRTLWWPRILLIPRVLSVGQGWMTWSTFSLCLVKYLGSHGQTGLSIFPHSYRIMVRLNQNILTDCVSNKVHQGPKKALSRGQYNHTSRPSTNHSLANASELQATCLRGGCGGNWDPYHGGPCRS